MTLISRKDAAAHLKLTTQRISQLVKLPGCPSATKAGRLLIEWPDFNLWYIALKVEEVRAAVAPANFDEARTRQVNAQAHQEELKLEQMRGKLMTVKDYERLSADMMARFDAKLRNLVQRIAAVNWSTDMTDRVRQATPLVDEVRGELHRGEDIPEEAA